MKHVTCFAAIVVAAVSIGCDKTDKKSESEPKRKPALGNLVAPSSIEDLAQAGKNQDGGQPHPGIPPLPAGANPVGQPPEVPLKFHERRVAGKAKIFGVLTDKVVNYDVEVRKNPKLKIVEHKINTSGPLAAYGSSYFTIGSKASMLNFKHQLDIMANLNENGRYPTYKQYIDLKNKMRVELVKLPGYQMYAYQEKKGTIVILEDPDLKAKITGN